MEAEYEVSLLVTRAKLLQTHQLTQTRISHLQLQSQCQIHILHVLTRLALDQPGYSTRFPERQMNNGFRGLARGQNLHVPVS